MAKLTKNQIRAERGFKKQADMCSNCLFCRWRLTSYICAKDDFTVKTANCCSKHERKEA
jgi:hypothetical protein